MMLRNGFDMDNEDSKWYDKFTEVDYRYVKNVSLNLK
jgi:hypothetical protein